MANPLVGLTGRAVAAAGPVFGGLLSLTFERTAGTDGYDYATDTHADGAPLTWTGEGYWRTVVTTDAGGRRTSRRVLMVTGDSLSPADGAVPGAAPLVPEPGDTVQVSGEAAAFALGPVTPTAAPGGGLAPLYACEVAF